MLTLYSKNNCTYCVQAKNYLKNNNIQFQEINIEQDPQAREFILSQGLRTMPQIFMAGKIFVEGGWSGLSKMTADEIQNEIDLRDSLANQTL